jgi:hypothetical protein
MLQHPDYILLYLQNIKKNLHDIFFFLNAFMELVKENLLSLMHQRTSGYLMKVHTCVFSVVSLCVNRFLIICFWKLNQKAIRNCFNSIHGSFKK